MVTVIVNGEPRQASRPGRNLLSFLRFDLGLTGTKYGCGEGLCGACTVLVDGHPIRACLTTVGAVGGGSIVTIEGLARDGVLHPVQQAFVDETAMQCGYCTPGFIMAAVALLQRAPSPSREQVREALGEHLCRCGVYQRIERAVLRAADALGRASGGRPGTP
ncbi:MAG TPA: (2Fe-2S)-binding protein [Dehalococcoidia bacterium]|nr:(2Fe-2S)-binding protein [Dehalococcoidia bacterium]